ncbi:MAG: hypothetical protein ABGW87_08445 [Sphingomonadaceae bacterium]
MKNVLEIRQGRAFGAGWQIRTGSGALSAKREIAEAAIVSAAPFVDCRAKPVQKYRSRELSALQPVAVSRGV